MYPDKGEFKHDLPGSLDPRCRLAAGIAFIFAVLHITHPFLLFALIGAALLALVRDIKTVLSRLAAVNMFCVLLFITLPLSGSGTSPPLLYTLRINASALFYMLFAASLGIGRLAPALTKMRVHAKLVALLILTYRYLFIMYDRVFRAVLSMRLRRPRQATPAAWRSYTALFASAFASAFFRAQKISRSAGARGFDGVFPVTRTFTWKIRDTAFLILSLSVSILLVYLDRNLGEGRQWRIPWVI
jgi:energy-coupling factor transporter transmembrane protein EcfT